MLPALATIPAPPTSGFELGPLDVRFYGILIAIGAYLALLLTIKRYTSYGGDPAIAERASLLAIVAGLLGARVGFVLPRLDRFLERPQDLFAIWQGGLAFFGGLTFGAIAVVWYVHHKSANLPAMADAVAPGLPLAQAIGRWGNYFNQELYGRPTDLPWALAVDPPYRRPGFEGESTFHPTFLYESLWNLGLVAVIIALGRRGRLRRGSLIFVYAIGAGIGRGWIELLRIDTAERYIGLSRNNWVAAAVLLLGVVGLVWWQRRGAGDDDAPVEASDVGETEGTPDTSDAGDGARNTAPDGSDGAPDPDPDER